MLSYLLLSALASAALCQDTTTVTTTLTKSGNPVTITINVTEATDAFNAGLAISKVAFNGNVTTAATRLYKFDGCSSNEKSQIYAGWQDSWQLMNAVAKDINYNEGAAIDFLGAPGLNQPQQSRMSALFANAATMQPGYISTPFDWRLHVRCDDPATLCPPNTIAYATNMDRESGLARINFCPLYFGGASLLDVITHGRSLSDPNAKYNLRTYEETKATTWFHELMHIDWVAQAGHYGGNKHVGDLKIVLKSGDGTRITRTAYGSPLAKTLARYPIQTGEWVLQNAENLALFALSKVMQNELGAYPHYPLVINPPDGPPSTYLFDVHSDGTVTLNQTDPLAAEIISPKASEIDEDGADISVVVDRFVPNAGNPIGETNTPLPSTSVTEGGTNTPFPTTPPTSRGRASGRNPGPAAPQPSGQRHRLRRKTGA